MPNTSQSQRQVGDRIWFGMGCFHFGYVKRPPYKFKLGEYIEALKAALESIPAVTDVSINIPNDNPDDLNIRRAPENLIEGEGYFPPLSFCWIQFKVYIPARVQGDLCGRFAAANTGTDRFIVYLNYAYESPVAYVALENPASGDREPSTGVQVVRAFLERELGAKNSSIRFEYLGPSPFHADCSLELLPAVSSGTGSFVVNHVRRRGYDLLKFTSDHPQHGDTVAALEALFAERLDNELGVFYWIESEEVRFARQWERIQGEVTTLIQASQRSGWWDRIKNRARRSRILREVFTALISFDVGRTFALNSRQTSYRTTYPKGDVGFIRSFIDKEIADATKYPTKQITTLVGFLEHRRSKAVELAVILLAAVVGGIAGATVTRVPASWNVMPSRQGDQRVYRGETKNVASASASPSPDARLTASPSLLPSSETTAKPETPLPSASGSPRP